MKDVLEQKHKVVAVVVTYNRKTLLRESVEALLSQNYYNLQILIVDNNSNDGTKEYISDLVDDIKVFYVNTGKNLGGSGGFNYGMKMAAKMECDYIWIMDDDCIVTADSLIKLVDFAQSKNDDFGYLSSYVEWKDGTPCKMNVQRCGLKKLITNFTENQEIKLASFVSMFTKPNVIEDVGLPIKDFFIWGDDWEYTYRIAKKYKCYYVADSKVIHKSAYNIGSDISKDEYERIPRYIYAYRNEKYFYKQAGFKGRIYHFIKIIIHLLRIIFSKIDHKKERFRAIFNGLKAGKKFNPSIEYIKLGDKPVNVLEFFGEPLSYGGQEAFMINMYNNFERSDIKYSFATPFYCDNKTLISLAEAKNDVIIAFNKQFNTKKRKKHILSCAKQLLQNNQYDVIHIQSCSLFTLVQVAKIAKKNNVKKIIVHSHSVGSINFQYKLIKKYSDLIIDKYVDKYLACSDLTAQWKFPKNIIEDKKYVVIKNGIDLKKFQFNEEQRNIYRKTFGITNEIVLCNVGGFAQEKNHNFIVEIAKGLKEKQFNYKFVLVGDGDSKEEIKAKIKEYQLEDRFIMLENRGDIAEIMMASDIFIMPSLFEGFPVILIESQTTGLKTISSNTVTKEAKITDIITCLPITDSAVWVDEILKTKEFNQKRENYSKVIEEKGFGANVSALLLEKIYLNEEM